MSDHSTLAYRPDIDGLRAIAVLSVVLYHFGVPGLGGGFVGVDIFFVISGFLIGGLLWREAEQTGRIALLAFFARRIRRLAPGFVAMALASAAAGYIFLLPFEYREFGKSLIAATVYLSNVHFFREAGYFDTGAEDKILLHTWSLAVEEQFYIVLPFVILLFARRLGLLRAVLWAAFAASFLSAIWVLPRSQPAAFYLFPFRAWELLAGVLLAVEAHKRSFAFTAPAWVGLLGLALTLIGIVIIPSGNQFPGFWAILPVLGPVMMIASGKRASPMTAALSHPIPVAIGLISYSLYLWHWPVFTLGQYTLGTLGALERTVLLILSFALAALSWRFIERPFRKGSPSLTKVYLGAAAASVGLLAIGGLIFVKDGLLNRFSAPLRTHIEASADFLQDWSRCTTPTSGSFQGIETCPIGPKGDTRVLIWGDSHVRALKEGLEQLAFETGTPALIIWRAGCPPIFGVSKAETAATAAQNAACTSANEQIEKALKTAPFERILLVGRWGYYAGGGGVGIDAENRISLEVAGTSGSQTEQMTNGLLQTASALENAGATVTVLAPIPEIADYDSRQMARNLAGWQGAADLDELTFTPRTEIEARADLIAGALGQLRTIDLTDKMCDAQTCRAIHDGVGQYFDNNHLTNSAARRVRSAFRPIFVGVSP